MDLIILFVVLLITSPLVRKEFNGEGDLNPVEMVDGASIAIDPDAFYNLNLVVKKFFGGDTVTIPGNVIIDGNLQCRGDVYFSGDKDETTIACDITQDLSDQISNDDKSLYKRSRRFISNLPTEFRNSEGYFCTLNWDDGNSYIRTKEFIVKNLNGSWGFGEGWDEKVPVPIKNTPNGLRVKHFISEGAAHMKDIYDFNGITPTFVHGYTNEVPDELDC